MIGHPALGEVVGADALAPVPGANLAPAALGVGGVHLGLLLLVDAAAQHLHGLFAVFHLAFLILAGGHDARGQVGDAHGRVRAVDMLAALAAGAEGVDTQVLGVDLHIHLIHLGQHGHGGGAGVDAALAFSAGHPLDAVHAGLKLHAAVGAVARQREHGLLDTAQLGPADVHLAHLQVVALGIAGVHAQQQRAKQAGLVAAGAAADFHHHVALVVGVLGDQEQLQLVAQVLLLLLQLLQLLLGHVRQVRA